MCTLVSPRLCDFTVHMFVKQERKKNLYVQRFWKYLFPLFYSLLSCPYIILRIFKRKLAIGLVILRFYCKGRGFGVMILRKLNFFICPIMEKLAFPKKIPRTQRYPRNPFEKQSTLFFSTKLLRPENVRYVFLRVILL